MGDRLAPDSVIGLDRNQFGVDPFPWTLGNRRWARVRRPNSSSTVSPEVRRPGSNKIKTLGGDSGLRCLKCSGKLWPETARIIPLSSGITAITSLKYMVSMTETPHVCPRQESRPCAAGTRRAAAPPRGRTNEALPVQMRNAERRCPYTAWQGPKSNPGDSCATSDHSVGPSQPLANSIPPMTFYLPKVRQPLLHGPAASAP